MTLIEMLISLSLLSVLMLIVLFSSTWIFGFIQNRLVALPSYVVGLSRAYSAVYLNAQNIQLSATYTVSSTAPAVTLYSKVGTGLQASTINFKDLIKAETLSTASGATVTLQIQTASVSIQQPADNKFLLMLYLSIPASDGRKFDNTVVIKKLVNAAPVPQQITASQSSGNVTINLYYPALGFGIRQPGSSNVQLVPDTSTITSVINAITSSTPYGIRSSATVTLTGTTSINDVTAYQSLYVESSTTAPSVFVTIPPLVGVDGTPCEDTTVKVGP
jgi:hypothetical protein